MKGDPLRRWVGGGGGEGERDGAGPRKKYTRARIARACVFMNARGQVCARARARVYPYICRSLRNACAHSRTHCRLRAWRSGKGKDVVKKTSGERAGDAARLFGRCRYYTRRDGRSALTVSVTDSRIADPSDFGDFKARLR
jgi:hypothetical protein